MVGAIGTEVSNCPYYILRTLTKFTFQSPRINPESSVQSGETEPSSEVFLVNETK